MKANDLMIGDWVYSSFSDIPCKVQYLELRESGYGSIKTSNVDGIKDIASLYPIPLTPEILEKNGMKPFDIDKLTDKATAKWWHKGGDFFIKQYHFKHHNFKPTYSFGCGNHTLIEGIEYVHQLQHALKLCGIDKTIEL